MSGPGYLAGGFRTAAGLPREGLSGTLALEGARQLKAAGVRAEHLEAVLGQVVRGQAVTGAGPAAAFVRQCQEAAPAPADRAPLLEHLGAVLRLMALEEAVRETGLTASPPVKRD